MKHNRTKTENSAIIQMVEMQTWKKKKKKNVYK